MGQKVNYNKKETNQLKKIVIIFVVLFVLLIFIRSVKDVLNSLKDKNNVSETSKKFYYSVSDYNSLEELLKKHNCKVINKNYNNKLLELYVSFGINLYEGEVSNERYFLTICKNIAEYIEYKDFQLIDENKKINIEVKCENTNIVEFKINGDVNYYLNHDSEINSRKKNNTITNFLVQSEELKKLNNEKWKEENINFGTKESTCDGYNIYFDEGIKYKTVSRNIFNVIFTSRYKSEIIGGLNVNSSKEDVENALGKPTFTNGEIVYGYIGKDNYVFFDFLNNQVSVYPVVNITNSEENQLKEYIKEMNSSNDVKRFVTNLTGYWLDFDKYEYDSDLVDLRYTLKGIQLSISGKSLKNGIFVYSNYIGNADIQEMDNVYFVGNDFVFEEEKNRINNEYLNRNIEGIVTDEEMKEIGINFALKFKSFDENSNIGAQFFSRDQKYADSELDKNLEISSYKWYDASKIIYSVNNNGIYLYNCETMENFKIIDLDERIEINFVEDNKIIYNENRILNINVN